MNRLFWNGLVPTLTEVIALLWPKKLHLISKNYHGKVFEGNAGRRLLKEANKLQDPDMYGKVGKKHWILLSLRSKRWTSETFKITGVSHMS